MAHLKGKSNIIHAIISVQKSVKENRQLAGKTMTNALNIEVYKNDNSVIRQVLPANFATSNNLQMLIYPYLQPSFILPSEMIAVANGQIEISFNTDFVKSLNWQVAEYEIKASNTTLFEGELRITARDLYLNKSQASKKTTPPQTAPCPSFNNLQVVTREEAEQDFKEINQ